MRKITPNRRKTVRRVMLHPGITIDRLGGYDVEGCLRDGYLTQRDGAVYVTPKGRAAASADRTRVKSGAFR